MVKKLIRVHEAKHELKRGSAGFLRSVSGWSMIALWLMAVWFLATIIGDWGATGDLDGTFLADARDLAEALRTDERVPRCIVRQLFRHATGRLEEASEARPLRALEDEFAASGYRFRELMLELARSEVFRVSGALDEEADE